MDDVITCIEEEYSENVFNIINSIKNSIKFTKETDEENIISFFIWKYEKCLGYIKFEHV